MAPRRNTRSNGVHHTADAKPDLAGALAAAHKALMLAGVSLNRMLTLRNLSRAGVEGALEQSRIAVSAIEKVLEAAGPRKHTDQPNPENTGTK